MFSIGVHLQSFSWTWQNKGLSTLNLITIQQHKSQQPERINGKIVLSVGAALRNSVFCPRLVLGLSSFVLLLALQWLCDALVMS